MHDESNPTELQFEVLSGKNTNRLCGEVNNVRVTMFDCNVFVTILSK